MKRFLPVAALVFSCANANAIIFITGSITPTPNVPGFITYSLTAVSDQGDIAGFDFVGDGSLGFFGPMNQVNPAGNASIFTDANGFFEFVGADILDDSQFAFASGDGTVVNASETDTSLQGALSLGTANAISGPVFFAQIAAPEGEQVDYLGNFTIITSTGPILEDVSGVLGVEIPEPTTAALLALGLAGFAARRRACK